MKGANMTAKVKIRGNGNCWWAEIKICHDFLENELVACNLLETIACKSKGQAKRKTIQFCSQLGLDVDWI